MLGLWEHQYTSFSGKGKERGEIMNYFIVFVGRSDCVDRMGY